MPGTKVPCCNEKDCIRLDDWSFKDGKYHIKTEGEWFTPPQNLLQFIQTPDGEAHGCYTKQHAMAYAAPKLIWYCVFIPLLGV